jgi:hypothetical protein
MSVATPQTTRYRPEELLVAKSQTIAGGAEWEVDAWRRINPYYAILQYFATTQTVGAKLRVTADSEASAYDEDMDAFLPLGNSEVAGLMAKKLMLVHVANLTGFAMPNYQFRYRLLVDQYSVAEKIRQGLLRQDSDFTTEELRLDKKFNLRENIAAGRLPYQFPMSTFDRLNRETIIKIVDVGVHLAAINAGSVADPTLQADVGPRIEAAEGEKLILFEVGTDQPVAAARQTFIVVDRDHDQGGYLMLNTWCFLDINHLENLWMPTPNEFYVHARSVVGETDFRIRYKYARCKLTLIDKIRWNLDMEPSEVAVADKLDLFDRVEAGLVNGADGRLV